MEQHWMVSQINRSWKDVTNAHNEEASFMWHTLMTFISFIEHKLMIHVALLLFVGLFVLMMRANFY